MCIERACAPLYIIFLGSLQFSSLIESFAWQINDDSAFLKGRAELIISPITWSGLGEKSILIIFLRTSRGCLPRLFQSKMIWVYIVIFNPLFLLLLLRQPSPLHYTHARLPHTHTHISGRRFGEHSRGEQRQASHLLCGWRDPCSRRCLRASPPLGKMLRAMGEARQPKGLGEPLWVKRVLDGGGC